MVDVWDIVLSVILSVLFTALGAAAPRFFKWLNYKIKYKKGYPKLQHLVHITLIYAENRYVKLLKQSNSWNAKTRESTIRASIQAIIEHIPEDAQKIITHLTRRTMYDFIDHMIWEQILNDPERDAIWKINNSERIK